PADVPATRDEQLVKALSYGMLPAETTRGLLDEARRLHEERLAYYKERERNLEERRKRGEISEEAYIGTKLTVMRAVSAEESYVRWCEKAGLLVVSARAPHGPFG
ncbi:MAG: hypothetical protein ACR2KW_10215, partial [Rubrobacter sp.]